MHLKCHFGEDGKRVYTVKKTGAGGKPTASAHPARFSPDDQFSRERYTLKRRYKLLPTQLSAQSDVGTGSQAAERAKKQKQTEESEICQIHVFETHWNGRRPFKVEVRIVKDPPQKSVTVYASLPLEDERRGESDSAFFEESPALTIKHCQTIFVGHSAQNDMTERSRGYGPMFHGNSILVHCKPNTGHGDDSQFKYVQIGKEVFEFVAFAKITHYVSPVGKSDVPFPYAVDEADNVYLIMENAVFNLHNSFASCLRAEAVRSGTQDPYLWFSQHQHITNPYENTLQLAVTHFQRIENFWVGNQIETLRWSGAERDKGAEFRQHQFKHRRHKKTQGGNKLPAAARAVSITLTDGSRETLTAETYKRMMTDFAEMMSLRSFPPRVVLLPFPQGL